MTSNWPGIRTGLKHIRINRDPPEQNLFSGGSLILTPPPRVNESLDLCPSQIKAGRYWLSAVGLRSVDLRASLLSYIEVLPLSCPQREDLHHSTRTRRPWSHFSPCKTVSLCWSFVTSVHSDSQQMHLVFGKTRVHYNLTDLPYAISVTDAIQLARQREEQKTSGTSTSFQGELPIHQVNLCKRICSNVVP